MLRESDLKKYFEGVVSIETLIDKIQSKEIERNIPEVPGSQNAPRTTKVTYSQEFHDLRNERFVLTRGHLIKLCDDFLAERMSAWNLEDIAFVLYACDGIDWGSNEEERKLIAGIMFHLSSPEINYPLSKNYIKDIKESLRSGCV